MVGPRLTTPLHLASSSPREANLCPARAHFCASITLGKTPPFFDEVVGGRRPCGVGINLVTGVPGGWVQYISLIYDVMKVDKPKDELEQFKKANEMIEKMTSIEIEA